MSQKWVFVSKAMSMLVTIESQSNSILYISYDIVYHWVACSDANSSYPSAKGKKNYCRATAYRGRGLMPLNEFPHI